MQIADRRMWRLHKNTRLDVLGRSENSVMTVSCLSSVAEDAVVKDDTVIVAD